jgi:hypothetical protein
MTTNPHSGYGWNPQQGWQPSGGSIPASNRKDPISQDPVVQWQWREKQSRREATEPHFMLPLGQQRSWRQYPEIGGGWGKYDRVMPSYVDVSPGLRKKRKKEKEREPNWMGPELGPLNIPDPGKQAGPPGDIGKPLGTDLEPYRGDVPSFVSDRDTRHHWINGRRVREPVGDLGTEEGESALVRAGHVKEGGVIDTTARELPAYARPGPRSRSPRALGMPEGGRQKRPGMSDRARLGIRNDLAGF